jgi:hypothetical protein
LNKIIGVKILTVEKDPINDATESETQKQLVTVEKDPVTDGNEPETQKRKWVGEDAIDKMLPKITTVTCIQNVL